MKRLLIVIASAALALSGCASGKTVGTEVCKPGQDPKKNHCVKLGERPSTPKPSSSKPRASDRPSTPSSTKKEPPKPSCKTYKGRVHTIVIKDTSGYNPESRNVLRGDYILFKNDDPQNSHSLTVDDTDFDTGILKPGTQKKLRVLLAPKYYPRWHDESIPYIQGGPLQVTANPQCP